MGWCGTDLGHVDHLEDLGQHLATRPLLIVGRVSTFPAAAPDACAMDINVTPDMSHIRKRVTINANVSPDMSQLWLGLVPWITLHMVRLTRAIPGHKPVTNPVTNITTNPVTKALKTQVTHPNHKPRHTHQSQTPSHI